MWSQISPTELQLEFRSTRYSTNKDMTERNVFKSELPNIDLQICLYHVLRTFSRECTTEKLGLTPGERHTILAKLQELTYAKSETDYQEKYNDFCAVSPNHLVTEYFNKNWHSIKEKWVEGLKTNKLIKEEWVEGLKTNKLNFNTSTNNRLESFFQKLKSCVTTRLSIREFIEKFLGLIASQRIKRRFKHISSKVPIQQSISDAETEYFSFVTPYAFKHVRQQPKKSEDVHITNENTVMTPTGPIEVSSDSCECGTFRSMCLPCSHLLAVLKRKGVSQFCSSSVLPRWKKSYNKPAQSEFSDGIPQCIRTPTRKKKVLTQTEKYRKAPMLLQSIASKLSQCGMEVIERKLSLLEEAKNYIELNQDFAIVALHYSDTDSVLLADIPEEPTHPDLTVTLHDEMAAEQVTLCDEMPAEEPIHPDLTVTLYDEMAAEEPIHPDLTVTLHDEMAAEQVTLRDEMPAEVMPEEEPAQLGIPEIATFPLKMRKHGRPKGSSTTAIGLPKNKKRKVVKTVPYFRKPTKTRQM